MAVLGAAGGVWNPSGAQAAVNAVRAFWAAINTYLPNELTLTVNPVVDYYDRETGALLGSNTAGTAPAVVTGLGSGSYVGGGGVKVTWETGQVRDGRRVRGASYIVPMDISAFTNTGTVASTPKSTINTAAANMITAMATGSLAMGVWSRPREATGTLAARAGAAYQVTSGVCSSKSAILRGRRD